MDGEELPDCVLEVNMLLLHEKGKICYMAGGATSEHTEEKSLELLGVSSQQISWKLGSFVVYQGELCISLINYEVQRTLSYLNPQCSQTMIKSAQISELF